MTHPLQHRKQLVVNKPMQTRIVLAISWPAASCVLLAGMILMAFAIRLGFEAAEADLVLPSLPAVVIATVAFLALATLALLYNALRFSHRIAGPVFRIQRTLESYMAGDTTARAHLRENDHLKDLASSLNRFLEWSAKTTASHGSGLAVVHLPNESHDEIGEEALAEVGAPVEGGREGRSE